MPIPGISPKETKETNIMMPSRKYRITDSKGNKTPYALKHGYIQVSEFYPLSEVYLTYEYGFYIVKGYSMEGKRIRQEYPRNSLKIARIYLNSGI